LEEAAAEEIKQEMPEDDCMMANLLEPEVKLEIKQEEDDDLEQDSSLGCQSER
jgi:hypothetical protein